MANLGEKTAERLELTAKYLGPVLWHKNQGFCYGNILNVAHFIGGGQVSVVLDVGMMIKLGLKATYCFSDIYSESGELLLKSNTLYLSDIPQRIDPMVLVHEAVHIFSVFLGKKGLILDNEELAYFVEGFMYAQWKPQKARSQVRYYDSELLGCLASDYYKENLDTVGEIRSEMFNKSMNFDYTKEGGVKGETNPYKSLETMVLSEYPYGTDNGKKIQANYKIRFW